MGDSWRERGLRDAAAAGDPAAWKALYDSAFDRVHAVVRWRCANQADLVDDVLQDTWLMAARKLRNFDPERAGFGDWVCGIAANILRNHLRSRKRRRTVPLECDPAGPSTEAARDRAERVAVALAALPTRYEQVLRAKYLDQQSVREIAAMTGEREGALESLLARARQAFREAYGATP